VARASQIRRLQESLSQYGDACRQLEKVALAKRDCGDLSGAVDDLRRVAEHGRDYLARGEFEAIRTAERLGRSLFEQEQYSAAEEIQSSVQSVAVKAWGLKSDIALEVTWRLVRTLIRLGRYDQIQLWSDEVVRARLNYQEESTFNARQYLYNVESVYSYLALPGTQWVRG
jgi:tetratricopeptide (TPR) repeat protein